MANNPTNYIPIVRVISIVGTKKWNLRHWYCWTSIYNRFKSLKSRCNNKNSKAYNNYWWRWIKCLWKSFEEFILDMWIPEWNLELERVNNDWHYCKENCVWATIDEQARNKRSNRNFTHNWITMCLTDWAKEIWVQPKALFKRIYDWKDFSYAINQDNYVTTK